MSAMNITAVNLWDKYTRLLHWSLALAVLFLTVSGWLMGQIIDDVLFWLEWHQIMGQVVIFLLLARIVLFFRRGSSHFSRFQIGAKDAQNIKQTLLFYASLARTPLPSWYAYNPVWRLLYIIFYLMLVVLAFSGLVANNNLLFGIYWPSVHQEFATGLYLWLFLHLVAVFLHDAKSRVNRISGMLSGVVFFESEAGSDQRDNVIKTSFDLTKK